METKGVNAAIGQAHEKLNSLIDGTVKAREKAGLRSLILAGESLQKAESHLAKALSQSTSKKKAPAATTAAEAPQKN